MGQTTELHDLGLKKFHLYIDEEYSHFYAVKNENNGRGLRFALVGEDGKANKDLSIDCYWTFTIRKSKGEYYQLKEPILATKERVDDVVFYTIFYPRLTTRIQGEARCQLTFINGNQVLMTKPYPFRVVEDLLDPDEIEIPDELLNVYERQLKEALEKTELKFNELSVNTENSLTELLNKGLVDIQSLINEGQISINQLISDSEHNIKLVIDNVNEEISEIVLEEVNKFNLLPRIEALENIDLSFKQDKILKDITTSKQYEFEIDNNRVFLKEV